MRRHLAGFMHGDQVMKVKPRAEPVKHCLNRVVLTNVRSIAAPARPTHAVYAWMLTFVGMGFCT